MSEAKSKARAARSPRATAPRSGRPWYAPLPRWYADDVEPGLLMRREPQRYVVRDIAKCCSAYQAEQLAAALNRGERSREIIRREHSARGVAEAAAADCRAVLLQLVDAVRATREPALGPRRTSPKLAAEQLAVAMAAAGRVLGDEPVFAPGGEPRGLKPAAQNRQEAAHG